MSKPLISLMLPTYARRADGFLQRAIESALAQTHREIELVVIDDGSVDGSADLIADFARRDSRVRHVRHERNVGLPALTLGLAAPTCAGDYYAFVFDDCELVETHCETLLQAAQEHPDASFVYGQAQSLWMNGGKLLIGQPYNTAAMARGDNHVPNVCVMFRRDLVEQVGWYDPHVIMKRFCDWDLWRRMAKLSSPYYVPAVLAREYGTMLAGSLGSRVSLRPDLMLRYAGTERDAKLRLSELAAYDPFRMDILPDLSPAEQDHLRYLMTEHLLTIKNDAALKSLYPGATMAEIEAGYLRQRIDDLLVDRNNMQQTVLALEPHFRERLTQQRLTQERLAQERLAQERLVQERLVQERLAQERIAQEHAAETEHLAQRLANMQASTSWRLTAPLRRAVTLARGLARRTQPAVPVSPDTVADSPPPAAAVQDGRRATRPPLKILAVGDGPIVSMELICQRPLAWLARTIGLQYAVTYAGALPALVDCRDLDLLLVVRAYDAETLTWVRQLADRGVPVIYLVDDDLRQIDSDSPTFQHMAALNASDNIVEFARLAREVWTFSEALRESFSPYARHVRVMPAIAGPDMLPEPHLPAPGEPDEIRFGFAGSITHAQNATLIESVVHELLEARPRLIFESIGQVFEGLVGHPRYQHFEALPSLDAFFEFLRSRAWTAAVAPLRDTPFNTAKTDNKYRTYASVGVPAAYSDAPAFRRSVRHEETGLLVGPEAADWKVAIERLLDDNLLRTHIIERSFADVSHRYSHRRIALDYLDGWSRHLELPRVLVVGPFELPSLEIVCRRPLLALARKGILNFRLINVADVTEDSLDWADALVIARACEPDAAEVLQRGKSRGLPSIFSWDDDFFAIPPEFPTLKAHYDAPDQRRALTEILSTVDLVQCSTERLAQRSEVFNTEVMVAPSGFDFSILPESLPPPRQGGSIRLGYFGSASRAAEFAFLLPALRRLMAERPETEVEFFGIAPPGSEVLPRVTLLPFEPDYAISFRKLIERQWDIGLSPLIQNDFTAAKLPAKYRDYGAVQIPAIYSNTGNYVKVVQDGVTGLLADNDVESWYRALLKMVDDEALRHRVAAAALADVRSIYSLDAACMAWLTALRRIGLAALPASLPDHRAI